jgi:hypothetical protein
VRRALGQEDHAALGELVLLVVVPDQRGALDQHEHLVLAGVLVIRRRLALGDVEPAHHQLAVGRGAVKQDREGSAGQPVELLLLFGLGKVEHAHVVFLPCRP